MMSPLSSASQPKAKVRRPALPVAAADVVSAAGRVIQGLTPAEEAFVQKQAKAYVRGLRSIQRAVLTGNLHLVRSRLFLVEHCFAGRFCSVLLAYPKKRGRVTLKQAKEMAEGVTTRSPSNEAVRVYEHRKPEGGVRPICDFGPRDRAAKRLVDDILRVIWGESPNEFVRKGRGRNAAVRKVLHEFEHGGVRRLVQADLKDFYGSHDHQALVKIIPLPKAVIQNTVLIPEHKRITNAAPISPSAARLGLPQGSRLSATVASKTVETLLASLPGARVALSHGDDMIVGVRTDEEAEMVKSTLASRVAEHPSGPFRLKTLAVIAPGTENDFLGYKFRHKSKAYGGGVRVSASKKACARMARRLASRLALMPSAHQWPTIETRCEKWVESFTEWGGGEVVATIAIVEVCNNVMPVVDEFRRIIRERKLVFKHLTEAQALFDTVFLPLVGPNARCAIARANQPKTPRTSAVAALIAGQVVC